MGSGLGSRHCSQKADLVATPEGISTFAEARNGRELSRSTNAVNPGPYPFESRLAWPLQHVLSRVPFWAGAKVHSRAKACAVEVGPQRVRSLLAT